MKKLYLIHFKNKFTDTEFWDIIYTDSIHLFCANSYKEYFKTEIFIAVKELSFIKSVYDDLMKRRITLSKGASKETFENIKLHFRIWKTEI